ncbi:hypothetical protein [Planctomycetes bacterium K23_9]|uniref:GH16 domain-containing protein n=1 Tax=Stieleria marina TaxID=1930275 RepID=A0A517NR82_9BACT|nr:hypothetical protein K239x_15770 [Planctomycetes bacterium K23_9]
MLRFKAELFALLAVVAPLNLFAEQWANVAADSSLPQGKGLADRFVADAGIAGNSSVIFAEDFEQSDYQKNWQDVRDDGGVLTLVTAPSSFRSDAPANERFAPVGKRSLQVTARLTKNTGGGLTKWFESNDRLFIRFYVRFDKDVDYIHHFCTLRANKATHGKDAWSGFGGAGLKPLGSDRFSTALEPWGNWGKNPAPGKWHFYSYWQDMKPSPDGNYWGNAFDAEDERPIKKEEWICAEFMLKHNTPGKPDGEQAWWIDGKLIGHFKGINWRASGDLWANAFTLESYVTDRWTKQETNRVWFDNVVIARDYIGPAGL